jgi:hypothetical protein
MAEPERRSTGGVYPEGKLNSKQTCSGGPEARARRSDATLGPKATCDHALRGKSTAERGATLPL